MKVIMGLISSLFLLGLFVNALSTAEVAVAVPGPRVTVSQEPQNPYCKKLQCPSIDLRNNGRFSLTKEPLSNKCLLLCRFVVETETPKGTVYSFPNNDSFKVELCPLGTHAYGTDNSCTYSIPPWINASAIKQSFDGDCGADGPREMVNAFKERCNDLNDALSRANDAIAQASGEALCCGCMCLGEDARIANLPSVCEPGGFRCASDNQNKRIDSCKEIKFNDGSSLCVPNEMTDPCAASIASNGAPCKYKGTRGECILDKDGRCYVDANKGALLKCFVTSERVEPTDKIYEPGFSVYGCITSKNPPHDSECPGNVCVATVKDCKKGGEDNTTYIEGSCRNPIGDASGQSNVLEVPEAQTERDTGSNTSENSAANSQGSSSEPSMPMM